MKEDLKIEGLKDYPVKWVCNFQGQKAIGICGFSQKIAMFAHDERVTRFIQDIVIGYDKDQEGYGCEEKERCCNSECEWCNITIEDYLKLTSKNPSQDDILELEDGLKTLNEQLKKSDLLPFDKYEVVKL